MSGMMSSFNSIAPRVPRLAVLFFLFFVVVFSSSQPVNSQIFPLNFDFGQCNRRCQFEFSQAVEATGVRLSQHSCNCTLVVNNMDDEVDEHLHVVEQSEKLTTTKYAIIPFDNPYSPPYDPPYACCGADGVDYPTQEAACANGTYPLHGGYCGQCSNVHDIHIYNVTRNNMTNIAASCAAVYVLAGPEAAAGCFFKVAGLSAGCNECWVENFGCDAAQCMSICALDRALHLNNTKPDGSLNDCLECDEMYCGTPFINCAGANRRRSGIKSDIDRPADTIWKRTAC